MYLIKPVTLDDLVLSSHIPEVQEVIRLLDHITFEVKNKILPIVTKNNPIFKDFLEDSPLVNVRYIPHGTVNVYAVDLQECKYMTIFMSAYHHRQRMTVKNIMLKIQLPGDESLSMSLDSDLMSKELVDILIRLNNE